MSHIMLSTQDSLCDRKIVKTFGLISGNVVRSRNIVSNFFANVRTIFGGEIPELTKVVSDSRQHALERLMCEAEKLGANAIVGIRFTSSEINNACSEILVYGTAVTLTTE